MKKLFGIFKQRGCRVRYHNFGINWEDIINRNILGLVHGLFATNICLFIMLIIAGMTNLSLNWTIGIMIGTFIGNFIYRFCKGD